jgi:hypothetical protein
MFPKGELKIGDFAQLANRRRTDTGKKVGLVRMQKEAQKESGT